VKRVPAAPGRGAMILKRLNQGKKRSACPARGAVSWWA
jgi:hypothetical protein